MVHSFYKFHQVGGTTVAEVLMRGYTKLGLRVCCGPGCDLCASHHSLQPQCMARTCLGAPAQGRHVPLRVVSLLREPMDK